MSYTFLLDQGGESSVESCSVIALFAPLNWTRIVAGCSSNDSRTATCPGFRSGTTSARSTDNRGEELSTSSAADSLVKISASPVKGPDSAAVDRDCGRKWRGSLAKFDLDSHSWRTRQRSLAGGLIEFSETLPHWGSMRTGELFRLPTPSGLEAHRQLIICEKESGFSRSMPTPNTEGWISDGELRILCRLEFSEADIRRLTPRAAESKVQAALSRRLPTPTAQDAKNSTLPQSQRDRDSIPGYLLREQNGGGGLNPNWVEWLMGWPVGWTDLEPLATDKFQQWLHSHGGFWSAP